MEAGKAYMLALPPPRHGALKSFRVLVIDTDPVLPTNAAVRAAIDRLAANLGKADVKIERQSPLLPDFAASSRLYMRMLLSFLGATFAPEIHAGALEAAAKLAPDDISLAAERLRGIALSHRDWVLADGARARLRAQWRELFGTFDAVICPVMPTGNAPHQHRRQGLRLPRSAGMARHRHATRPAGHRHSDRPFAGRAAGRRADRRPLAGRSHAAKIGRTDRARIRRFCTAAGV